MAIELAIADLEEHGELDRCGVRTPCGEPRYTAEQVLGDWFPASRRVAANSHDEIGGDIAPGAILY